MRVCFYAHIESMTNILVTIYVYELCMICHTDFSEHFFILSIKLVSCCCCFRNLFLMYLAGISLCVFFFFKTTTSSVYTGS